MRKDIIHYMEVDANWPPCGAKKDTVITSRFAIKVTCKQCLKWLEKRKKEDG